jgi:hypothetical protein
MTNKWSALSAVLLAPMLLTACDRAGSRLAYGDVNRIIVVAPDDLWAVVQDSVLSVLEPRIFTVRDERTFELTHVAPGDPNYPTLRQFRQVLTIGHADHSWVEPALADADVVTGGGIAERQDVWARRQLVTALVLSRENPVQSTFDQLPELRDLLDRRYRDFVRARMFASDPDTALQRRLAQEAGFSLLLPNLYRSERRDEAYVFRTETDMGAQLMRTITVVSRPGADPVSAEEALAWRAELAGRIYDPPQVTLQERFEASPLDHLPGAVLVQGSYSATDRGWPFGGPFISMAVPCPAGNRTFFVDGWIHAPGRPKYEYMIQYETILASFQCAP